MTQLYKVTLTEAGYSATLEDESHRATFKEQDLVYRFPFEVPAFGVFDLTFDLSFE